MKNAKTNRIVAALIMSVCFTLPVHAQNAPDQTLFTNVHVFDGEMRNPYQEGTLGTVSEGGYADLLLVEGNPLEDLGAVTNVDNLKIIMKDGVIYKNTL